MTVDDEPTGAGPDFGVFLMATVETLRAHLATLGEFDAEESEYWQRERQVIRDAVRELRWCDDQLTFLLTGEHVLHGKFYDRERQERLHRQLREEYKDRTVTEAGPEPELHDFYPPPFRSDYGYLEVSLPESATEAEQRRFTERHQ